MAKAPPTLEQFTKYHRAWEYFNTALFGGKLRPCLLNFSRHRGSLGFFTPNRVTTAANGSWTPRILERGCSIKEGQMSRRLTSTDREHLANYRRKLQLVKDQTTLCASGYWNGLYVHGSGGIGKSYAVLQRLHEMGVRYILHNTRLSGPAFFGSLEKHDKATHVIEDVEQIFKERTNMSLVRSACWGQKDKKGKQQRLVTYGVHPAERTVLFEGQIIFSGNRPLQDIPELRALATRISVQEVVVTPEELLALMKQICTGDFVSDKGVLPSSLCWEVFDEVVRLWPAGKMYDLRILERCFAARMAVNDLKGEVRSTWQEIVAAEIKGRSAPGPISREGRIAQETVLAIELSKKRLPGERLLAEWQRRTGNPTLDTYYRRLRKAR
jgi:hypothetical protein